MLLRVAVPRLLLTLAAAVAVVLVPLAPSPAEAEFDDTRGSIYAEAVDALASRGIVEGCGDGTDFCFGQQVRRDQLASLLDRALGLPEAEDAGFVDVDRDSVHADAIDGVAAAAITVGCQDDAFCPGGSTTRGQAASLLARAFDLPPADTAYFDEGGVHADAIDRVAAAGITDGCAAAPTAFCTSHTLTRGQVAILLARALGHVDRVEPRTLEERREEERQQAQVTDRFPDEVWDDLAECESGQNWSINTGNGFYGGLQFSLSSWQAVGGSGYPHHATREEQIIRGDRLQQKQGWGAWPSCSEQLGYR